MMDEVFFHLFTNLRLESGQTSLTEKLKSFFPCCIVLDVLFDCKMHLITLTKNSHIKQSVELDSLFADPR